MAIIVKSPNKIVVVARHGGALTRAQAKCEKAKLNRSVTCRRDGRNNSIERVQDWFPSVDLAGFSEILSQPQAEIG
jgi:hypothetical protein